MFPSFEKEQRLQNKIGALLYLHSCLPRDSLDFLRMLNIKNVCEQWLACFE